MFQGTQDILGKLLVALLLIFAINNEPVLGKALTQALQGVIFFAIAPVQTMQLMPVSFTRIHGIQTFLQDFPGQVKPDLDHIDMVIFQVLFKGLHLLQIFIKLCITQRAFSLHGTAKQITVPVTKQHHDLAFGRNKTCIRLPQGLLRAG